MSQSYLCQDRSFGKPSKDQSYSSVSANTAAAAKVTACNLVADNEVNTGLVMAHQVETKELIIDGILFDGSEPAEPGPPGAAGADGPPGAAGTLPPTISQGIIYDGTSLRDPAGDALNPVVAFAADSKNDVVDRYIDLGEAGITSTWATFPLRNQSGATFNQSAISINMTVDTYGGNITQPFRSATGSTLLVMEDLTTTTRYTAHGAEYSSREFTSEPIGYDPIRPFRKSYADFFGGTFIFGTLLFGSDFRSILFTSNNSTNVGGFFVEAVWLDNAGPTTKLMMRFVRNSASMGSNFTLGVNDPILVTPVTV